MNAKMMTDASERDGFIVALDQGPASSPTALRQYGLPESQYANESDMFRLMHDFRARIITAPAFSGSKVLGAILYEKTMDGDVQGKPVPVYLWEDRGVIPFLKVDDGLATEQDGVQVMKPMPGLQPLLERAVQKGIFGTKMRSAIQHANSAGIARVVKQQFEFAKEILAHGLIPIIEPEVSVKSTTKQEAEAILRDEILKELDRMPSGQRVMLKLTIPTVANFYKPLVDHEAVARVVALSGGYSRTDACEKLSRNHGIIASFSRALSEDLRASMTDAEFDASIGAAIDQIFSASAVKL
ncbi:fructose bisphosphate aldolase [Agrobacterium burrii]